MSIQKQAMAAKRDGIRVDQVLAMRQAETAEVRTYTLYVCKHVYMVYDWLTAL